MDTELLLFLAILMGIAFFITSQAKDRHGQKYGLKRMAMIWSVAVAAMGLYALLNPRIESAEGESVSFPIVPLILICLPGLMILSNMFNKKQNGGRK